MPRRGLLIAGGVALALTIASTWVVVLYEDYLSSPIDPASRERVLVRVRPGSFDEVVESLVARGLVKDPTFFKVYATLTGKRDRVKAGAYLLARSWTPRELLDHLIDADPADRVRLTTPEGQSVWQVADRIDALGLATRAEVLDAAADWGLALELGLPARAPSGLALTDRGHVYAFEGYLFPKTYELPAESDARALVKRMGRQFLTEWAAVKAAHRVGYERVRREHGLDDHALVTLASLVEEETANGAERALIAGVFYNRLRKQWRLQTDPTLVYHPERYGKVPTVVDRKNDRNPWNTYVVRGLPPGPISSPGAAALAAVLEPARTDMLFFVAKRDGTGTHHFSRTAKEHEDAVRRYLK